MFCGVELSKFKTVTRPAATPSSRFHLVLAVLLCLLHAVLAVTATVDKSMTADEIAHFTAGQAYNLRNDYRLQPENGNLPQRLAALPMTIAGVELPPPALESWRTADVWNYGYAFFYGRPLPVEQWMFLGRAVIALVSAATGLLVFLWSRALFGPRGAFLSLVLFVFCPGFLAHGALATSDVVMTFFFVASVSAWWLHLERPGFAWAAVSSITLGLAFVAKFSAVLLPPMLALIGIIWGAGKARGGGWRGILARLARSTAVHAAVAVALIWTFYGFRFSAFAPGLAEHATFNHGWGVMLQGLGLPAKVLWWMKEWRLLPEAWLYGLTFVLQFSQARGAFMSGEYSVTGWVTFFPWAFLIKTTLSFLVLIAAAAGAGLHDRWRSRMRGDAAGDITLIRPLTPLIVLFVVYWVTSLTSHLNIGHRHILPTYPLLFVAAGYLGRFMSGGQPFVAGCVVLLGGWHVLESFAARPHYLAYFNQIVGGSKNGWRHLVDSSLDWGQDLPGLKRWLDVHAHGDSVYLSYFGTGDPAYEGITATPLPSLPEVGAPRRWHALAPGIYAVSATMLQHVYSGIRGPWTKELEAEYQQLKVLEPTLLEFQNDPARQADLLREVPAANWRLAWKRYEQLRFARLCHYLRIRTPDAVIGHTLFVFRLTGAELGEAVQGSLPQWRELIERTVMAKPLTPPASR